VDKIERYLVERGLTGNTDVSSGEARDQEHSEESSENDEISDEEQVLIKHKLYVYIS
jgi:hypothetical protein